MNRFAIVLLISLSVVACKQKKKKEQAEAFFPVASFLQAQTKHVDTSLYRIVQLVKDGKGNATTTYLPREAFRKAAAPFLELPDIAAPKWRDDYEESKIFDQELNKVILSYSTTEKAHEVQREDVVLQQTDDSSAVENIIIQQVKNEGNTTTIRNMVWYVNKRFTIVTKTQKENEPETVQTVEVIWNDFTDAPNR